LQFLNRQWHGKKESTVAVFRPRGRPSQAISTAEEREERRSVSGLHETFKAKREKTTKERRKNKQTNKQTRIPSTNNAVTKNAQNRQKKKNDDKTSQKSKQQKNWKRARSKNPDKETTKKLQGWFKKKKLITILS
jgi:hypothetical protein